MKVGIVQPRIQLGVDALKQNRDHLCQMADQLFGGGVRLIVLPECANSQYFPDSAQMVAELAEPLDGPTVQGWEALAALRSGYIVGGILEQTPDGIYNTAVLVGPRGLIGCYRKMHRFGWEQEWLCAGDDLPVFELPDLGIRLGMLVCYDLRFTEAVQALALSGIDLLAVPTTWTSIGKRILWDQHGYSLQDHLVIGYAYAHHIAVICADRVGQEGTVTFLGASIAVHPGGEIAIGPLSGHEPTAAIADLDVKSARNKRIGAAGDLQRDRRPEHYRTRIITESENSSRIAT
jgi:predicted amidohydrolase